MINLINGSALHARQASDFCPELILCTHLHHSGFESNTEDRQSVPFPEDTAEDVAPLTRRRHAGTRVWVWTGWRQTRGRQVAAQSLPPNKLGTRCGTANTPCNNGRKQWHSGKCSYRARAARRPEWTSGGFDLRGASWNGVSLRSEVTSKYMR